MRKLIRTRKATEALELSRKRVSEEKLATLQTIRSESESRKYF